MQVANRGSIPRTINKWMLSSAGQSVALITPGSLVQVQQHPPWESSLMVKQSALTRRSGGSSPSFLTMGVRRSWRAGTDCKSVAARLRRFDFFNTHHMAGWQSPAYRACLENKWTVKGPIRSNRIPALLRGVSSIGRARG